ncbi:MAG: OmpH family outer membrane protein [Flavobacteriales bacterium]|jgi:Skp family chaperone for outer membrane proteins|nr:OmpH family outer membrane protein [Flavobacteriales bacterium]
MRNKLFLLPLTILLTTFFVDAQSQRGVRIGYIDMEYILESVPEYQEALTQLDGKVQRWRKDIENQQKEIDQLKLNLSNERVLLTKELIEERDEDVKIKEDALFKYQQDRFGPNGDLMIQKRQLVQPVQDQVFNAVQEIAGNRQYDFIFDKSADVVMLYAAERNDISDQVVRMINRSAKRSQVENKEDKRNVEQRDSMSDEQDKTLSEREKASEDKKSEREALIAERNRVRDSVRDAKQKEFEERRQRILDERNNPNSGGDGKSGENNTNAESDTKSAREVIVEERRRVQDSIQNTRRMEQEQRKNQILEDRQRRQDSIKGIRENNIPPPVQAGSEDGDDGGN